MFKPPFSQQHSCSWLCGLEIKGIRHKSKRPGNCHAIKNPNHYWYLLIMIKSGGLCMIRIESKWSQRLDFPTWNIKDQIMAAKYSNLKKNMYIGFCVAFLFGFVLFSFVLILFFFIFIYFFLRQACYLTMPITRYRGQHIG